MIATIDGNGIKVVCQRAEKNKLTNVLNKVLSALTEAGKRHFEEGSVTVSGLAKCV